VGRPRRRIRYAWERLPKHRALGKLERLAYARHREDLRTGHERGLFFSDKAADRAVAFFEEFLRHWKGRWNGQPFILEPFQEFVIRSLFGWKYSATGLRRYRFAYLQCARKQGKTELAAGVGLLGTVGDREAGAEVYSAATKRDQAKLTFDAAARMARRSDDLVEFVKIFGGFPQSKTNNISCEELGSYFEPLAADDEKLDGLGPHFLIADELHKWKGRGLYDVLESGQGARTQPLFFQITTPGVGREGVCREQREYVERILEGDVADDEYFAYVCEPDEGDDFKKPTTWEKANPNIGVTVTYDDLAKERDRALASPGRINAFMRYKCGMWTEQLDRWLNMERWRACGGRFDEEILLGRECYIGLDLSSTTDLTAEVLWFPPVEEFPYHYLLPRVWVPEDRVAALTRNSRRLYEEWIRDGSLITTPGDVIDQDAVRSQVNADAELFDIQEIGIDRWGSPGLIADLQDRDGFTVATIPQTVGGLSAPSKQFEILLGQEMIRHGDHPVLAWSAGNAAIWTDTNDNIRPSKKSSGDRIDPIVAAIIALARAMLFADDRSIWETEDAVF
jgi:phage terminase large subunit-like protein